MGWASGSEVASRLITWIDKRFSGDPSLEEAYAEMISVFEDADCDTLYECLGDSPEFDAAYYAKYPKDAC